MVSSPESQTLSGGQLWRRSGSNGRKVLTRVACSSYWNFLMAFTVPLLLIHLLVHPQPGRFTNYTSLLGAAGLAIEALLPLPQMYANYASRSCRGFRASVLANWLFGDAMKMGFFFLSDTGKVPWAFKLCGCFQALCDLGLGAQYWMYGEGPEEGMEIHLA